MKNTFNLPHIEGLASRQAHADLPEGTFERELGRDGFFGPATHTYHPRPPTGWSDWEGPLRPRLFDLARERYTVTSPWNARSILVNEHVRIRHWQIDAPMDHLVRNADGDDLLFLHEGQAELFCDYGHLSLVEGDYLVIPRGTAWRIETQRLTALLIEATGDRYRLPDRGLASQHAIFDPAMLDIPKIDDVFMAQQDADTPWQIHVKRRQMLSRITFPYNPLDAVGWTGTLFPVRINWRAIRPLMSHRMHLPPLAQTTFVADRFLVVTFTPRPFEIDPGAIKIPFFHSNDDCDEVLFFHQGQFVSRDESCLGMMTLNPSGFTHGPHPGALESLLVPKRSGLDEVAVMIDTFDALDIDPAAAALEVPGYINSWQSKVPK